MPNAEFGIQNENLQPEAPARRPVAFIQVDLDGLWAVRRSYGGRGAPEQDDPVYSHALPALLDLFDGLTIKATFFVVGADARVAWKRRQLEAVVQRGHELANHSMTHNLELKRLDAEPLASEVVGCQQVLKEALGVEARGFRAPGYGFSQPLLETLARLSFWYDASLLPTPWGAVLRWIGRRISATPRREKAQYGSRQDWHAPLNPYRLDPNRKSKIENPKSELWEIPVSVTRRLRFPFHGGVGFLLGKRWVGRAIRSLQRGEGFLNYLIHGMDLVDGRKWEVTPSRMGRWLFAGGTRERLEFFTEICRKISRRFEIRRTDQWVEEARTCAENH